MSDGKDAVREIFKRLNEKQMKKLLYFSGGWCLPCKSFGPIMDQVAQSGIPVQKVNVDTDTEATQAFGVRNVPTVVLVENGQEVKRFSGVKSMQQVIDFYNG
jgi:thioredoxin 1